MQRAYLCLFGLFFDPADGGDIFLRNDELSPKCTVYTTEDRSPQFKTTGMYLYVFVLHFYLIASYPNL
jgi:hypothetical protein